MDALRDHERENREGKSADDAKEEYVRKEEQPHVVTKHGDGGDDLERITVKNGKIRFYVHKKLLHRC